MIKIKITNIFNVYILIKLIFDCSYLTTTTSCKVSANMQTINSNADIKMLLDPWVKDLKYPTEKSTLQKCKLTKNRVNLLKVMLHMVIMKYYRK